NARPEPPARILFLIADGFRSDYVEWYKPPNIQRLIAEGTRVTEVRNVFPTVTTPNMTSLVTGSYPRTTGIAANAQYVKELDRTVIAFASDHGMSAFETKQASREPAAALREAGFRVATSAKELEAGTQIVVLPAGVRLVYFRAALTADEKEKARKALTGISGV